MTVISVMTLVIYIKTGLCMTCTLYELLFWRSEHTGQFNSLYLHTSLRNLTCKATHTEQTQDLFQNS